MEFCRKNNLINIKKHQFAEVLKYTFENIDIRKTLKNGFQTYGLCPFNENAVNYDKIFDRSTQVCK